MWSSCLVLSLHMLFTLGFEFQRSSQEETLFHNLVMHKRYAEYVPNDLFHYLVHKRQAYNVNDVQFGMKFISNSKDSHPGQSTKEIKQDSGPIVNITDGIDSVKHLHRLHVLIGGKPPIENTIVEAISLVLKRLKKVNDREQEIHQDFKTNPILAKLNARSKEVEALKKRTHRRRVYLSVGESHPFDSLAGGLIGK